MLQLQGAAQRHLARPALAHLGGAIMPNPAIIGVATTAARHRVGGAAYSTTALAGPSKLGPHLLLAAHQLHQPTPPRQRTQTRSFACSPTRNAAPSSPSSSSTEAVTDGRAPPPRRGTLLSPESARLDKSEPSYALGHDVYPPQALESIYPVRRPIKGASDKVAVAMVRFARWMFDTATSYPRHRDVFPALLPEQASATVDTPAPTTVGQAKRAQRTKREPDAAKSDSEAQLLARDGLPMQMTLREMRRRGLAFDGAQWMMRIVFLESVAGVPGMVAAVCRHLASMRLLRRDNGWILTLLEEAANERQHLLVALKVYQPGWFMRLMLLGAQGVFFNFFFLLYLASPRVAHSFVSHLESEAVLTYTRILEDIKGGRLPEFERFPAPAIARDYWGLAPDATLVDVIKSLRADEAGHRFVNGTLAELEATDPNPFTYERPPALLAGRQWGLTRDEALAWFERERQRRGAEAKERLESDTAKESAAISAGKAEAPVVEKVASSSSTETAAAMAK